jgi:hypothetical protein
MKFFIDELAKPIARRMGTAIGTAILALGAAEQLALQVETVSTALILFAFDLVMSYRGRN